MRSFNWRPNRTSFVLWASFADGKSHVVAEESEVHQSETAIRHMDEFELIKETLGNLHEKIEIEAGSITQVQSPSWVEKLRYPFGNGHIQRLKF